MNETVRQMSRKQLGDIASLLMTIVPSLSHSDAQEIIGNKGKFKKHLSKAFDSFLNRPAKVWMTLTVGGKTKTELFQVLKDGNHRMKVWAKEMIKNDLFTTAEHPITLDLSLVCLQELGFTEKTTLPEIFKRAEKSGLSLCPAEVGPYLWMKNLESGISLSIAMNSIPDHDGSESIFGLFFAKGDDRSHWLRSHPGNHEMSRYTPSSLFVFVCSR